MKKVNFWTMATWALIAIFISLLFLTCYEHVPQVAKITISNKSGEEVKDFKFFGTSGLYTVIESIKNNESKTISYDIANNIFRVVTAPLGIEYSIPNGKTFNKDDRDGETDMLSQGSFTITINANNWTISSN